MDLSVVILNLNTEGLLRNCLNSLAVVELNQPGQPTMEVWVVDNGSNDGSITMIRRDFPWVNLIENKENLGFAAGNNCALPNCTGNYVLFLNSDTRVPAGTLVTLIDYLNGNEQVGAVTPFVEMRDGRLDMNCHRGFPTPWTALSYFTGLSRIFPRSKVFGGYYQTYKDLALIHEVDAIEGAFMMVRREAGEQAAVAPSRWWDEDFFFFGEDLDFCFRLREKGWKIIYNPGVKIWHYKGATHGFNKQGVVSFSKEEKEKLVRSTTQAMELFYRKHYRQKYPFWVTALVLFSISFLGRLRSLKGGI